MTDENLDGLVRTIASKYIARGVLTPDELETAGAEGVEVARARFDESKGFKFSTYATWWIRQRITLALKDAEGRALVEALNPDEVRVLLGTARRDRSALSDFVLGHAAHGRLLAEQVAPADE